MVSPLPKVLAAPPDSVRMVSCRIRTLSPLTIDLYDTTVYDAVKITGSTLSVGPAQAFITSSSKPIVFQTGA